MQSFIEACASSLRLSLDVVKLTSEGKGKFLAENPGQIAKVQELDAHIQKIIDLTVRKQELIFDAFMQIIRETAQNPNYNWEQVVVTTLCQ